MNAKSQSGRYDNRAVYVNRSTPATANVERHDGIQVIYIYSSDCPNGIETLT